MGASLSDIMTTAQNIVTAINSAGRAYLSVHGLQNLAEVSVATLVQKIPGRVASISVTTAGSADGALYDSVLAASPTNQIYVIPMDVGLYVVDLPVNFGIVAVPGTDQVLTISYSS